MVVHGHVKECGCGWSPKREGEKNEREREREVEEEERRGNEPRLHIYKRQGRGGESAPPSRVFLERGWEEGRADLVNPFGGEIRAGGAASVYMVWKCVFA